jgi:hypothetical protein
MENTHTSDWIPAEDDIPLWLPAAIYRVLADPETQDGGTNHRNAIAEVFNDFPRASINRIVDALIAYGVLTETGETEREYGDLSIAPYMEEGS